MTETRFYFAFEDGSLSYDCVRCGAKCCRGGGIGTLRARELPPLLALYPELPTFVALEKTGADVVTLHNYAPGCHFLDRNSRCAIERDHGVSLKPSLCRIFPFGHLRRVADRLVVVPQLECPLEVVAPPEYALESSHAELSALISSTFPPERQRAIERLGGESYPPSLLDLEERIRTLGSRYFEGGSAMDLWADQLALTIAFAFHKQAALDAPLSEEQRAKAAIVLQHYVVLWGQLLDVDASRPPSRETERRLVALAPALRMLRIERWMPMRAPMFLAALTLYAALSDEASGHSLTTPGIRQLLDFSEPMLWLLAHLEDSVRVVRPHLLAEAAQSAASGAAQLMLAALRLDGTLPLRSVCDSLGSIDPLARVEALTAAAPVLSAALALPAR